MEEYDGHSGRLRNHPLSAGNREYTAGAVASIAFGQAVPAVDGNVLRVIARITGDEGDVLDSAVKRRFGAWVRGCFARGPARRFQSGIDGVGSYGMSA